MAVRSKPYKACSKSLEKLYGDVLRMTARERRTLWNDIKKMSTTNCSWMMYAARPLLKDFVLMASTSKTRQRLAAQS